MPVLSALRALGIRIAIDDFGTGYSSLAYLRRFPIDTLKIDKSFIDDITESNDNKELASTIILMGHNLGFHVIAEGVETECQLAFLKKNVIHIRDILIALLFQQKNLLN